MAHLSAEQLEAGLEQILESPSDQGRLEMIVRRPQIGEREVLEEGQLGLTEGLVGDNWSRRPSSRTGDGTAHPDMQINLMNSRTIALLARSKDRWPLAGDQLYVDLDLTSENLPPGTKLTIGEAVIEVTAQPHTGCMKFVERFGREAMKFVSSTRGKQYNLRGINAKVVQPGRICAGDTVTKS